MATTAQPTTPTNTFVGTCQEVTDAVIKALEKRHDHLAVSLEPGRPTKEHHYRCQLQRLITFHSIIKGYPTPYYITYKQAQKLGGVIKKGEKGIRIIYCAEVDLRNQNAEANQQPIPDATAKPKNIMVPKTYTVLTSLNPKILISQLQYRTKN
jgi:antirestriction protein ArdC